MQKRCSCVDKHACFDELTAKRDDVRGAAKRKLVDKPAAITTSFKPPSRRRPCPVMTNCIISQPKCRRRQF